MLLQQYITFVFASFLAFVDTTLAEPPAFSAALAKGYDLGAYGTHPVSILRTVDYNTSRILRKTWSDACDKPDEYFFLTPHGFNITHNGPEILDQDGNTIWFGHDFNNSYGLRPQLYRGEYYLTWWSGNEDHGHGSGNFYMMDKHYQVFKNLTAVGEELFGDQHEFEISPDGTALITVYVSKKANLTEFGFKGEGYIYDCYIQELDIETNDLLFEWRVSEHISLGETDHSRSFHGTKENDPWDAYHLNSIQKDIKGNYLISIRHTSTIYYFSGETGDILWRFGGKEHDFKDSTGAAAVSFWGQHHARLHADGKFMTVFDNGMFPIGAPAQGLVIALDQDSMTADLVAKISHPDKYIATTRGSLAVEDDGSLLMGFGSTPSFTEFSPDGRTVQCDYQFGTLHSGFNGAWSDKGVASYRVYRQKWVGYPLSAPQVVFEPHDERFYVSWNGATEVRKWTLEGMTVSGDKSGQWKDIGVIERTTFESNTSVPVRNYKQFRLTAMEKDGGLLGQWTYTPDGEIIEQLYIFSPSTPPLLRIFTIGLTHRFLLIVVAFAFIGFTITIVSRSHVLSISIMAEGSRMPLARLAQNLRRPKFSKSPADSYRECNEDAELAPFIGKDEVEGVWPK